MRAWVRFRRRWKCFISRKMSRYLSANSKQDRLKCVSLSVTWLRLEPATFRNEERWPLDHEFQLQADVFCICYNSCCVFGTYRFPISEGKIYELEFSWYLLFPPRECWITSNVSLLVVTRSWGSSVNIVSDYRLDNRGSIPDINRIFFSCSLCVQTISEVLPASFPVGSRGSFPRG
jgi:hypothetical protein